MEAVFLWWIAVVKLWQNKQLATHYLKAASFWSRCMVWRVFPWIGSITLTRDAHIPGPALGAPNMASGRSSDSKASAILSATSASSSPAASLSSYKNKLRPIVVFSSFYCID